MEKTSGSAGVFFGSPSVNPLVSADRLARHRSCFIEVMKTNPFRFGAGAACGMGLFLASVSHSAEVQIGMATSPSRLQTLERKADEYDRYRAQYLELQETLDRMLALLPLEEQDEGSEQTVEAGFGLLSDLIKKAERVEVLSREIEEVQAELVLSKEQYDKLKDELTTIRGDWERESTIIRTYKADLEKWKNKADELRETIEWLLLGEFEYYEIKEGDTLPGIAANPLVYGDPSRSIWLRQVNERRVKNLDHLIVGEVLIIPRFPRNGAYEF